jgi:hypothetical protein
MGFQTGDNVPAGIGAMPGIWNPTPWQPGIPRQLRIPRQPGTPRQVGIPRQPWAGRGARPRIDIGALLAGRAPGLGKWNAPGLQPGNVPGMQPGNVPGMRPRGNALTNLKRLLGPGAGALPNTMGRANRCPRCGSPLGGAPLRAQPGPAPQNVGAIGDLLRAAAPGLRRFA